MSPRRSPRLKGLSPAPKGPGPKPQRPKRVKNAAEDSVRQAMYEAKLAVWSAANEEHKDAMKIRKKKTMAAWKAAHKGAAKKVAPPPAAPPAALSPPSRLETGFPEHGALLVQDDGDDDKDDGDDDKDDDAPRFHGLSRGIVQLSSTSRPSHGVAEQTARNLFTPTGLGTMKRSMKRSVEVCLASVRLSPAC